MLYVMFAFTQNLYTMIFKQIFCDFFTNYSLSFLLKQLVPKYSKVVSRQTFTLTVLV